ncbi:hypothetical protein HDU85_001697 [Gaertneriomyces sp. JEL0708]|nr:hypothetical protein HDU85_001697 [Gaertneriomyces sp. JEL0708]
MLHPGIRAVRYVDPLNTKLVDPSQGRVDSGSSISAGSPQDDRLPSKRRNPRRLAKLRPKQSALPRKAHWHAGSTIQAGVDLDTDILEDLRSASPSEKTWVRNVKKVRTVPSLKEDLEYEEDPGNIQTLLSTLITAGHPVISTTVEPVCQRQYSPPCLPASMMHIANESVKDHREIRDQIKEYCTEYHQNDNWIQMISSDSFGAPIGMAERIPISVAFMSSTIKHIYSSSASFLEGTQGYIRFSSFGSELLTEVVAYLYWLWYTTFSDPERATSMPKSPRSLPPLKSIPFVPCFELVLDLIDAALYFDLPGLVEICAATAASNTEDISSFGDLATPLIREVLKRLSIGDLCLVEYDLLQTYECHSSSAEKPYVNTASTWIRNLMRIHAHLAEHSIALPRIGESIADFARRKCVQFYIEECLKGGLVSEKMLRILENESSALTDLQIVITERASTISKEQWSRIFETSKGLQRLFVHVEYSQFWIVDTIVACMRGSGADIMWTFVCRDAIAVPEDIFATKKDDRGRVESTTAANGQDKLYGKTTEASGTSGWPPARQPVMSLRREAVVAEAGRPPPHHAPLNLRLKIGPKGLLWAEVLHSVSLISCDVHHLSMPGIPVQASFITSLPRNLRTLNIPSAIAGHTPDIARLLSTYIQSATFLAALNIGGNAFTTHGLTSVLAAVAANTSITSLDLSNINLNAVILSLTPVLTTRKMHRLALASTALLPRSVVDFGTILLEETHDKRRKVDVEEWDFGGLMCAPATVHALAAVLFSKNVKIQKLLLNGAGSSQRLGDGGLQVLLLSMRQCRHSPQYLDLSSQELSDESAVLFTSLVSQPACSLQYLGLKENNITDDGATALQVVLNKGHSRNCVINLSGNLLSPRKIRVLEQTLRRDGCVWAFGRKNT